MRSGFIFFRLPAFALRATARQASPLFKYLADLSRRSTKCVDGVENVLRVLGLFNIIAAS